LPAGLPEQPGKKRPLASREIVCRLPSMLEAPVHCKMRDGSLPARTNQEQ
jgi:hypothetical protein